VAGIERFGGDVRSIEVADPRELRGGEVLISVKAAGVGNWDDIVRNGDWDVGRIPPMALGVEATGIIAAVGAHVDRWSAGHEVLTHPLPLADQGTWAPWLIAREEVLVVKPPGVSWAVAGSFPVPALTAIQVLDDALAVVPGSTLLVNGASGATGGLLVSLAAHRGVEVLVTAGPSSRARVLGAGAATVVDYHDPSWPQEILQTTGGRGVDAAANAARGAASTAMQAVRDGGRLATITSDAPEAERGIDVSSVYVRPDAAQLEQATRELGARRVDFRVGARFPLADAREALARATGGAGGGVVLEP
jgi:NADPH:quinone reductase-like Zn-dependent oxidoreductase